MTERPKTENTRVRMSRVDFAYDDGFSHSRSSFEVNDPSLVENRWSRLVSYNDHLNDQVMQVLDLVVSWGCPQVPFLFPLLTPKLSDDDYRTAIVRATELAEVFEEQSWPWLCLKCYVEWVEACGIASTDGSALLFADRLFQVGATVRELELSIRNKSHVLERQKQRDALSSAAPERAAWNAERKREADTWRYHAERVMALLKKTSSNSALADHILTHWEKADTEVVPPKPRKKTLQNWLSQAKPSRDRASPGKTD